MQSPIRMGLIGLGTISEFQMKALAEIEYLTLEGACDLDPSKKVLNEEIPFYTNVHDLLDSDIDAVLISTPNETHVELCKQAILHRKHVLVEKPAVQDPKQLEELDRLATEHHVRLIVAYHSSFARDIEWFVHEYKAKSDSYGPLTGFQCLFFDPYIQEGKLNPKAIPLQGSWIDSGVNALSVMERFIPLDQLKMAESRLSNINGFQCSDLQASVDFTFPVKGFQQKGRGQIETNWSLGLNQKITTLHFDQTGQSVILHHSNQQVIHVDRNQNKQVLMDASERPRLVNHYLGVFMNFVNHLRNGTNNIETSIELHRLLYEPFGGKYNGSK